MFLRASFSVVFFLGILSFTWPARALDLSLDPAGAAGPKDRELLLSLIAEVKEALPPKMKSRLNGFQIQVLVDPQSIASYGHLKGVKVKRNGGLATLILAPPKYPHLAKKSLIRELARLYDRARLRAPRVEAPVSEDQAFLGLAGWPNMGVLEATPERSNFLVQRSPDPTEWLEPEQAFAVNFDFFLTDSEYKCRRPLLFRFLKNHFEGFDPFPSSSCEAAPVVKISAGASPNSESLYEYLPFSRLYAVDYLYAGEGSAFMSRFGHAMIRLVFCKPGAELGENCRRDVVYHRVVSFRASVNTPDLEAMKGLSGGYPSILFVFKFLDIVSEYTTYDFRELKSLPLNFTRSQLRQLYDAMLEMHWGYEGKYYFLANNCATETLNLLKRAFFFEAGVFSKILQLHVVRPDTLFDQLVDSGLGDISQLANLKQAESKFLYFPSKEPMYQDYLDVLRKAGLVASTMSLDDYIESNAGWRTASVVIPLVKLEVKQKARLAVAAGLLEELIVFRIKKKILVDMETDAIPEIKSNPSDFTQFLEDVREGLELVEYFSSPGYFFKSGLGYGIPTAEEINRLGADRSIHLKAKRACELLSKFEAYYLNKFGPAEYVNEFEGSKHNLKVLREAQDVRSELLPQINPSGSGRAGKAMSCDERH